MLIRRYGNRKCYDTHSHKYVTLREIAGFVRTGVTVTVVDMVSGEDVTDRMLAEALVEELKKPGWSCDRPALVRLIQRAKFTDTEEEEVSA